MRVSRKQMAENRTRILDEASRLFQARGFESVSVAEVMSAAGLTHGGFYGHFASKDDLIAQMLAHRLAGPRDTPASMGAYCAGYLSDSHRAAVGEGCPIAALAAEVPRRPAAAQAAMAAGIAAQIARLAQLSDADDPAAQRRDAIGSWSAMVGALVLSRAVDDPGLAADILNGTRDWIDAAGTGAAPAPPPGRAEA